MLTKKKGVSDQAYIFGDEPHSFDSFYEDTQRTRLKQNVFDRYYEVNKNRILTQLLYANEIAQKAGKKAFITTPGIGCGYFAGDYRTEVAGQHGLFSRVVQKLLHEHCHQLPNIQCVYYDYYQTAPGYPEPPAFFCKFGNIMFGSAAGSQTRLGPLAPNFAFGNVHSELRDLKLENSLRFDLQAADFASYPINEGLALNNTSDEAAKGRVTSAPQTILGIPGVYLHDNDRVLYRSEYINDNTGEKFLGLTKYDRAFVVRDPQKSKEGEWLKEILPQCKFLPMEPHKLFSALSQPATYQNTILTFPSYVFSNEQPPQKIHPGTIYFQSDSCTFIDLNGRQQVYDIRNYNLWCDQNNLSPTDREGYLYLELTKNYFIPKCICLPQPDGTNFFKKGGFFFYMHDGKMLCGDTFYSQEKESILPDNLDWQTQKSEVQSMILQLLVSHHAIQPTVNFEISGYIFVAEPGKPLWALEKTSPIQNQQIHQPPVFIPVPQPSSQPPVFTGGTPTHQQSSNHPGSAGRGRGRGNQPRNNPTPGGRGQPSIPSAPNNQTPSGRGQHPGTQTPAPAQNQPPILVNKEEISFFNKLARNFFSLFPQSFLTLLALAIGLLIAACWPLLSPSAAPILVGIAAFTFLAGLIALPILMYTGYQAWANRQNQSPSFGAYLKQWFSSEKSILYISLTTLALIAAALLLTFAFSVFPLAFAPLFDAMKVFFSFTGLDSAGLEVLANVFTGLFLSTMPLLIPALVHFVNNVLADQKEENQSAVMPDQSLNNLGANVGQQLPKPPFASGAVQLGNTANTGRPPSLQNPSKTS